MANDEEEIRDKMMTMGNKMPKRWKSLDSLTNQQRRRNEENIDEMPKKQWEKSSRGQQKQYWSNIDLNEKNGRDFLLNLDMEIRELERIRSASLAERQFNNFILAGIQNNLNRSFGNSGDFLEHNNINNNSVTATDDDDVMRERSSMRKISNGGITVLKNGKILDVWVVWLLYLFC